MDCDELKFWLAMVFILLCGWLQGMDEAHVWPLMVALKYKFDVSLSTWLHPPGESSSF